MRPSPQDNFDLPIADIPRRIFTFMREYTVLALVVLTITLCLLFYLFVVRPPEHFPIGALITIEEGDTLSEIAQKFREQDVVRSRFWFTSFVMFVGSEGAVVAGDYFFSTPLDVTEVAKRVTQGRYGLTPIRVTVPEGATSFDIATIFARRFGRFDPEIFIKIAQPKEGFLFPDTYFFLPNVEAREVVRVMEQNFERKVAEIQEEIAVFGQPLDEVVVMASLLEKEARRLETRRMIAGVLWRRLEINMLLQVDATFLYINGKSTFDLTLTDLATSSPYNTYKHKGLPPGPIANPSLDAILAAVTPIESNYLFYLADHYGVTHYAENFEQHKANKARYLD